jgi:tetratricopeptide (TPR) repeat protein
MSLMHLGNIYMQTHRNTEAQENYETALCILQNTENVPEKLVSCYNNLGAFYLQLEDYKKALEYLEYALPLLEKMKALDKPRGAAIYRQIGNVYDGLGNFIQAQEYLNKAVAIEERVFGNLHPTTAVTYDYLGRLFYKNSEYVKAEEFLQKALSIYEKYYGEFHPATADICHSLGECCYHKQEFMSAARFLERCCKILTEIKPGDVLPEEIRQRLQEVHEMLKSSGT